VAARDTELLAESDAQTLLLAEQAEKAMRQVCESVLE
jgi:hypothetical protein